MLCHNNVIYSIQSDSYQLCGAFVYCCEHFCFLGNEKKNYGISILKRYEKDMKTWGDVFDDVIQINK